MEKGAKDANPTAYWAVGQLKQLHPVFFAALEARHNAPPSDAVVEANEELVVSTGQAMSL